MPVNREQLSVAKARAVNIARFICDEDPLVIANNMDKIKRRNLLTIWPTAREIGLAIEAIVQRAAEMEVFSNQRLYSSAVLAFVRFVRSASDGDGIVFHVPPLSRPDVGMGTDSTLGG